MLIIHSIILPPKAEGGAQAPGAPSLDTPLGMYRLQLGDKSSTIERISSAYLKPYKVQHGCIETSARHVYVSNIVPTETFSTENYGAIATARNSKQEHPQQCQDKYELDKHEVAAADEDDDFNSIALKEQLYLYNLLRLWLNGAWSLQLRPKKMIMDLM